MKGDAELLASGDADYLMPIDADAPSGGVLRWVGAGGQAGDQEIPVNLR